jgi:streptomycin 6-kinase
MEIPKIVRRKARLAGASDWLDTLPALVAELERRWSITVGPAYADATEAYVARAVTDDGTPAVLKLAMPADGAGGVRHEIATLRLAGGDGCARLLRDDAGRGALLLERLGRSLHDLALPVARRHAILCDVARQVWRPAAGAGLPSGADKGRSLRAFVAATWETAGRPCAERTVEHALACASRRTAAHDDERARLVHGDVHQWNALARGDGFALVDPDGLLAEPEYDLGVIMREDPVELLRGDPQRRARWLAARTGLSAAAIWEWGVVERVSTGLLCVSVGLPVGAQMLAAADHIAETAERRNMATAAGGRRLRR